MENQNTIQESWMTIKDAARRLKVNHNTIRSYITKKELRATKIGQGWRISEEDLKTFIAKRSNMGWAA